RPSSSYSAAKKRQPSKSATKKAIKEAAHHKPNPHSNPPNHEPSQISGTFSKISENMRKHIPTHPSSLHGCAF
ncbi:hypothetical protein GBAR_LOCUS23002, partial [Geodia barretti]